MNKCRIVTKHHDAPAVQFRTSVSSLLALLLFASIMFLSACGGSSSHASPQNSTLSGNWQFTMTPPSDGSFVGGLQGGFLLQRNNSVSGQMTYSVAAPPTLGGVAAVCNSGTAPVGGTITGQNVTLTSTVGSQTFTFTGVLSGSAITGSYSSTNGTAANGSPCGTATSGLSWSATAVPSVSGPIQGNFHSANGTNAQVTGTLTQGDNIGASNATVTGTLSFVDPLTGFINYSCFSDAAVNGQISGNTLVLQIISADPSNSGSVIGQIGGVASPPLNTVTVVGTPGGYVIQNTVPPLGDFRGYAVFSKACPGSLTSPGDAGNLCLALSASTACQQGITLSPPTIVFPAQIMGSSPVAQTITLTNSSNSTLDGLTLNWAGLDQGYSYGTQLTGFSDFNGAPNFTEMDNCGAGESLQPNLTGAPFSLSSGQSCLISISFTPQQSCPWIPYNIGTNDWAAPATCPQTETASLTVQNVPSPNNDDSNTSFVVPIKGTALSAVQPSTRELDFGAEALGQASLPQFLTFTNISTNPVQILGSVPCASGSDTLTLPRPVTTNGQIGGVEVVVQGQIGLPVLQVIGPTVPPFATTISYGCDNDLQSGVPNFQIQDACSGVTLTPHSSCTVQVTYVPQPSTVQTSGLDYFLELNTQECVAGTVSNCEIDSGRFPVELTASPTSPLRMSPGAGVDFGTVSVGKSSGSQNVTVLNDPNLPDAQPVTLVGKPVVKGNYTETDDCPFVLNPGSTCTLTITFKPKAAGYNPGTVSINYTPEPSANPQVVHLRGTGQ